MIMEMAKIASGQYGIPMQIHDVTDCGGCRTGARLFSGCPNCKIRKCAMELGHESCASAVNMDAINF